MRSWIYGVILAVLALVGLFMASRAHDAMIYTIGLLLFGFALAFIFGLIARHTGHASAQNEH